MAREVVGEHEWERYVQINMREQVLCVACFERIKAMIEKQTWSWINHCAE